MTDTLAERRKDSATRLETFRGKLENAAAMCEGKACVYVTGSFGRSEAGTHSDLDLFIVCDSHELHGKETPDLGNLDLICVQAELIRATHDSGFPNFSGDGEYLKRHSISALVKTTGKPEDDSTNTFTARMLLLLESQPLIGESIYWRAIDHVIRQYWRNFENNEKKFVPAFLTNDIVRLWRTFCVNYEARTSDVPEAKRNKRRLTNYKLKHSRMLTCYSALVYLLALHNQQHTVTPDDVREMVRKTPTQRLEWLRTAGLTPDPTAVVDPLLERHSQFLQQTNFDEPTLLRSMADDTLRRKYLQEANEFGDKVFALIDLVGQKKRLHRLLVV